MIYRSFLPGLFCACACALAAENGPVAAPHSSPLPSAASASCCCPCAETHPFFDASATPAWHLLTPARAEQDIPLALKLAQQRIEAICSVTEPTYENTFGALQYADRELDVATSLMSHLSSVMDSPAQRAAEQKLMPLVAAFQSSIALNERLWSVLKKAAAQRWVRDLDPERKRFVELTMDGFRTSGADLPADRKARLAEIHQQLELLTQKYQQNVLDSTNAWQLVLTDKKDVAGMPESWLRTACQQALEKGYGTPDQPNWLVTLQYTSSSPVMKFNENEQVRKKVYEATESIGYAGKFNNEDLVRRIIELRREMAEILGFANYADLTTHDRMAGSGARAKEFVEGLHARVKPAFDREVNELLAFISEKTGRKATTIDAWNRAYWMEKLRAEKYDFDTESLRPYYEAGHVFEGMFAIFSKLYGIRITERPARCGELSAADRAAGAVEVWYPGVRFFEVHDEKDGRLLGSFYMDWFPRASKRGGAWMIPMHVGHAADGAEPRVPHMAAICGNLTPPAGDRPALFSHYDVETAFHEFGHLMHVILSDTKIKALGGTSVAWDFVECPSQINESWTWEPETTRLFSRHYKTGEPMPAELLDKLLASRNFMSACMFMGQLSVGKVDLEMYMNYDRYRDLSLDKAEDQILQGYLMPLSTERRALLYNLTHIITGGYSAGYYSYKWAEALAADAFTRFKKEGLLNPETGRAFREEILSKGNTRPAAELFRNFMGRDLNPDALLEKCGILPAPAGK